MKKELNISIILGAFIIGLSIILAGYFIGQGNYKSVKQLGNVDSTVLTLKEASDYLGISQDHIKSIIEIEEDSLMRTGSFVGAMISYIKINDEYYFYKENLDIWVMCWGGDRYIVLCSKG